jgi:CHASE3 domain sensor protein
MAKRGLGAVSLREHFETLLSVRLALFEAQIEAVRTEVAALDRRLTDSGERAREDVASASAILDRRLEAMNEFRRQIEAERAGYASRAELIQAFDSAGKRTDDLQGIVRQLGERTTSLAAERAGQHDQSALASSRVALLISAILVVLSLLGLGITIVFNVAHL